MQQINDLSARRMHYQDLIQTATQRVIESGWWILGPECKRFEQLFSAYIGVDYCVGLANGTDAIELALKAMRIKANDLVATVANAGMYTSSALSAIGAQPFFMDVNPDTSCVTLNEVMRAVEAKVKALVVTHLYGQAVPEIAEISQFCRENDVLLLEDCAQAHGAKIHDKQVGLFGDAASFSFYPTKNLGALGDGGAVVTNNSELAEQLGMLRQYGWTAKYKVELAGARNSRLDELQAAILAELLPFLDESNERRRTIANYYHQGIKHAAIARPPISGKDYVAHLYVIRTEKRNELREHLRYLEIASEVHYPIPDHRQPVFANQFATINLKNTEELSQQILTLPCYPEMRDEQVEKVVNAINGWQP